MLHVVVYGSNLAAVCGYALWRGGAPERWAAALMALAFVASLSVPAGAGARFHGMQGTTLSIDLALLIALVALAAKANRFWPIWMAAIQLLATGIQLAEAYDRALVSWLYKPTGEKIPYPMIILLAIGTRRHRERCRRFGGDPDWSPPHPDLLR